MIPTDNSSEMLSIYADWLEDQDIDTAELREGISSEETNQFYCESINNSVGCSCMTKVGVGESARIQDVAGGYMIVGSIVKGLGG